MKFIITGKGTGTVMLYDVENKGSAVATFYTVNQLLDAGHEVLGVTRRKPFACTPLTVNGEPASRPVKVEGTKRSAVTFMKGIRRSREELKTVREAQKKRDAVLKEKKAEAKRAAAEQEKTAKELRKQERIAKKEAEEKARKQKKLDKVIKAIWRKTTVSHQSSKCLCLLSYVKNVATEYNEDETTYYTLYAGTPSAMTAMAKLIRDYAEMPGWEASELISDLRSRFKSDGRASCCIALDDFSFPSYVQVAADSNVILSVRNDYEDSSAKWQLSKWNNYVPELLDSRHRSADDYNYGSVSNRDGNAKGFGISLLKNYKHLRNMPSMGHMVRDYARGYGW